MSEGQWASVHRANADGHMPRRVGPCLSRLAWQKVAAGARQLQQAKLTLNPKP